jgi:1-acyl-sn-glycerol-3-phosphate acyltransferase
LESGCRRSFLALAKTLLALVITIITIIIFTPLGLLSLLLSPMGLRRPMSWIIHEIAQVWARCIIGITGCSIEVEGRENIPLSGGVCFVSNHVGLYDVILALAYAGQPFGFIAKRELLFVPFINMWIIILGGLFIDRKNIRRAFKTMNHGIEKLQKGLSMMIFPEGTRSKGQGLLPFKSGAIKLATNSLAPIVPVAISGSYDVFGNDYRLRAAKVRMVFCPAIFTADMDSKDRRHNLADHVHSIIEAALNIT